MNGFGFAPLKIEGTIKTSDGYKAVPAGNGYSIGEAFLATEQQYRGFMAMMKIVGKKRGWKK